MIKRYMPPEWAPHTQTWMAFPRGAYDTAGISHAEAHQAWATVANTIADHEPVSMLCHPDDRLAALKLLSSNVELYDFETNDAWMRDIGPTFIDCDGELAGVDWKFNGWGDNTSFEWRNDAKVAEKILALIDSPRKTSSMVNEGGGIHVDGKGHILLTETVQLDPDRNPDWDKRRVEQEIHSQLGTMRAIWLPDGLYRDYKSHGTRGHVDMVACFTPDGSVLVHQQTAEEHPDHGHFNKIRDIIEQHNIACRGLPAPLVLKDNVDWVDYSYINHYACNGAIVCPSFADYNDAVAQEILADMYPGREIRMLDSRVIFAMGGGIHCITQQQPSLANH